MNSGIPLKANEPFIFCLRSLYESYGYSHYKMSKFEEYDLYSKNKDFLVSDGVITFTDTSGKLLALKPDVTLSIIKNTKGSSASIQKLYYNENVYRVSKNTHTFKEIMQAGLECIGNVDTFCVYEVMKLAVKSLECISDNCVLDVSHLGILTGLLDYVGINDEDMDDVLRCIGEKNTHGLQRICRGLGIPDERTDILLKTVRLHGTPDTVNGKISSLLDGIIEKELLDGFADMTLSLGNRVNIDFSLVEDSRYYNGFIFKGFIEGVPNSVLSGGQYDTLMKKMNRDESAVGFAVYLDMLEQLNREKEKFDVDVILVYNKQSVFSEIEKAAEKIRKEGKSVLVADKPISGLRYISLMKYENGEVTEIENNA